MSGARSPRSEDQFLCSICLDVFTDPVSTPCGHNYCKICITHHWHVNVPYKCPMCKKAFKKRPELQVKTFISEMVAEFRREAQQKPVKNLEGRMCRQHDKLLELFCKTDQMCVCMLCSVLEHRTHEFKIEELKQSVRISKEGAAREKAAGVQVFTALKESVERGLIQLIKEIEEQQETTEQQAEGFITELEQEISELRKRSTEVEQLSHSEDHLHLLQSFSSLKAAAPTKDGTEVRVCPSYEGTWQQEVSDQH
uniref:RING-type domain-containing protein n=1 Tax=Monopterus albus TaxID=43700 RepID=A0A3Q3IYZ3_MONAL